MSCFLLVEGRGRSVVDCDCEIFEEWKDERESVIDTLSGGGEKGAVVERMKYTGDGK